MDFYKILNDIMDEKNMSIPDVARSCGLPDSTIRRILSRKSKTVALEVAFKISNGLNVSLERLNGQSYSLKNESYSNKDIEIIKKYRALDKHGKTLVDNVLDLEHKRVTSEQNKTFVVDIAARGGRKQVTLSEEGYKSLMADIEKGLNSEFPDIFDKREEK